MFYDIFIRSQIKLYNKVLSNNNRTIIIIIKSKITLNISVNNIILKIPNIVESYVSCINIRRI